MWTSKHSILIYSTPDKVFPWLKQMGNSRAGWYSYDWIDNFGKKSYMHIEPTFQTIKAGDKIPYAEILELEENKKITYTFGSISQFTYELEILNGNTLLTSILKAQGPSWLLNLTLAPAHFIMQRKQFTEIKKRAESK